MNNMIPTSAQIVIGAVLGIVYGVAIGFIVWLLIGGVS